MSAPSRTGNITFTVPATADADASIGDHIFNLCCAIVVTGALVGFDWLLGQQLVGNVLGLLGGGGLLTALAALVLVHVVIALGASTVLALAACVAAAWRLNKDLVSHRR